MAANWRSANRLAGAAVLLGLIALIAGYAIAESKTTIAIAFVAVPLLILRRIKRYDGLALAAILTLAVPSWYTFGSPQAAVFRIAAVSALATALFARKVCFTLADGAVVAIVVVTVLGWLLQDDQPGVGKLVLNEMLPLSFYVSARTLPVRQIGRIMTLVSIAGVLGAATVIYEFVAGQVLFHDHLSYVWNPTDTTIFRPGGIFGSPPTAAAVLAMAILCGIPVNRMLSRKWRSMHRACLTVMIIACALTFTRTSLIGLGVGLLTYLLLMRSSLITPPRLLAAAATLFIGVVVVLPQIENTRTFQQGIVRPGNLAARENYWQLALPIITASTHNVIFGIGSERTLIPRTGGAVPSSLATAPALFEHSTQNQYVLTALENGLIGLLVLLAWIAVVIRTGLRTVREESDRLSAALVGAILVFVVVLLANDALLSQPGFAMAALVSGLIVARSTAKRGTQEELSKMVQP
jgi:O-antigen ligase